MSANWYSESRTAIKRVYGQDWKLFAALLAATSPHASVKCNLTLAKKAYWQLREGRLARNGFNRTHWSNIQRVAQDLPLQGQKVSRFYENLIGNEQCVTVDIWVLRHYEIKLKSPSAKLYKQLEKLVQDEAGALGISPAHHQANIWAEARKSNGSFADGLRQYRLF